MNKRLFLILLLAAYSLSSPVRAAIYQAASKKYILYEAVNSGGETLEKDKHVLQDSKGDSLGGQYGAGSYTFTPGLFGVMATGEVTYIPYMPPTSQLEDTGLIRKTNIVRQGKDLVITWDYGSSGPSKVKIWVDSAQRAEYDANPARFTLLANVASGTKTYTDYTAAYDGDNKYYRVVPDPLVTGTDILDPKNNSITVGKVEVAVPADKYDFVALPFMEDDYLLKNIIGEQLGEKAEFYFWDRKTQKNPGATFSNKKWSGPDEVVNVKLRLGDGFYVRARSNRQLTLVGRFGKLTSPFTKTLERKDDYNLIAFPYPTKKTIKLMGIVAELKADLYEWQKYKAYAGSTYTQVKGQNVWSDQAIADLQLARPRFYRPTAKLKWEINP